MHYCIGHLVGEEVIRIELTPYIETSIQENLVFSSGFTAKNFAQGLFYRITIALKPHHLRRKDYEFNTAVMDLINDRQTGYLTELRAKYPDMRIV